MSTALGRRSTAAGQSGALLRTCTRQREMQDARSHRGSNQPLETSVLICIPCDTLRRVHETGVSDCNELVELHPIVFYFCLTGYMVVTPPARCRARPVLPRQQTFSSGSCIMHWPPPIPSVTTRIFFPSGLRAYFGIYENNILTRQCDTVQLAAEALFRTN